MRGAFLFHAGCAMRRGPRVRAAPRVSPRASLVCPFCKDRVERARSVVCSRPRCEALYHAECWDECAASYGRCAVFGCGSRQAHGIPRRSWRPHLVAIGLSALVLLGTSVAGAGRVDPPPAPVVVTIDYNVLIEIANTKYRRACALYEASAKREGPERTTKLHEARRLLQTGGELPTSFAEMQARARDEIGAQQIIEWVRERVEDVQPRRWSGVVCSGGDSREMEVNMLLTMIRKQLAVERSKMDASVNPIGK